MLFLMPSTVTGWNRNTFSSAYDECVFKEMMQYHAGKCKFFVTVEEKGEWYFFTEDHKKFRFVVPEKAMRRIKERCRRKGL